MAIRTTGTSRLPHKTTAFRTIGTSHRPRRTTAFRTIGTSRQNIEGIKDAWAQGGGKLPQAISAALPKYDGKTTYGILITNEGDVVPLQSGGATPLFDNYSSASHVEGKAAIWIRDHGSTGGVVYHNNTDGTCGYCVSHVPTLLPEGARLSIVPPPDAVPNNSRYKASPIDRVGNEKRPNPPAQGDFFARQP